MGTRLSSRWWTSMLSCAMPDFLMAVNPAACWPRRTAERCFFYAHESDIATIERLAIWLSKQSWCGAMLAAERVRIVPGTLPASIGNIDGRRSPDLTMSFTWSSTPNDAGFPGQTVSSGDPVGVGTHGGMSRHELRNTLIARGPSFLRSTVVDTPTGNIDVAPTILHHFGFTRWRRYGRPCPASSPRRRR